MEKTYTEEQVIKLLNTFADIVDDLYRPYTSNNYQASDAVEGFIQNINSYKLSPKNQYTLIMVGTEEQSNIGFLTQKGELEYNDLRCFNEYRKKILDSSNQYLYLLSNEKIKDNEKGWCYHESTGFLPIGIAFQNSFGSAIKWQQDNCQKVVMTNDLKMVDIPNFPMSFLKKFCEGFQERGGQRVIENFKLGNLDK